LKEDYDRGGPDTFHGYASYAVLGERRLPVCSPAILDHNPLIAAAELVNQTLLHVGTVPRLWRDLLQAAEHAGLQPAATLTLDHFYLSIQTAIAGLGIAMGPSTLVGDDLDAGRLIAPFPDISLPARSYFAYVPQQGGPNSAGDTFREWLTRVTDEMR
jgi:LysR family glycine cleavage system transcriptional activator